MLHATIDIQQEKALLRKIKAVLEKAIVEQESINKNELYKNFKSMLKQSEYIEQLHAWQLNHR
jgi:hypothetical protein